MRLVNSVIVLKMGVLQTASDTFFSICSTIALTVTTVTEWTASILHANYILVTYLYTSTCYVANLIFTTVNWILQSVWIVLVYVFDFLSEVYACVCALLVLLWRICVLVYKLFCLLFTGVETLVLGLWNGGVITYKALHQSALEVLETCESTRDYMAMMAQDFLVYVCDFFTAVGTFSTWVIRGLWVGIGYVPATLSCIPSYIWQRLADLGQRLASWVSFAFMGVTQETYIGIGICCMVYLTLSRLVHILHSRGFTLFSGRGRRHGATRPAHDDIAPMAFDRGFESDLEEDAVDNSSQEASDNENNDDDGDESDAQTELTLSDGDSDDDHSAGSESDVSLNSQTFTSEESDREIDIQLPASGGDNSLPSRCSTPSRHAAKDMNSDDYERELERERDKRKCVVCQDANKSVLIMPCRHMCLCVLCANQIVRSTLAGRRVCPLCRRRIEKVMDVYV